MSVALPFLKYLRKSSKLIWRLNDVSEDDCLTYSLLVYYLGAYFFSGESYTLSIWSGLDRVNCVQVGGAIQSKEHPESTLSAQKNSPFATLVDNAELILICDSIW